MCKLTKDFEIHYGKHSTSFDIKSYPNNLLDIVEDIFNNAVNNAKKIVMKKDKTIIYV